MLRKKQTVNHLKGNINIYGARESLALGEEKDQMHEAVIHLLGQKGSGITSSDRLTIIDLRYMQRFPGMHQKEESAERCWRR